MREPAQFGLEGRTFAARMVPPWLPRKVKRKTIMSNWTVWQLDKRKGDANDAKKLLGANLPSVSSLHCLSSPCPCLSSHSLWLTSIVKYYPGCISHTHATWLSKSLAALHDAVRACTGVPLPFPFCAAHPAQNWFETEPWCWKMLKAQFLKNR